MLSGRKGESGEGITQREIGKMKGIQGDDGERERKEKKRIRVYDRRRERKGYRES